MPDRLPMQSYRANARWRNSRLMESRFNRASIFLGELEVGSGESIQVHALGCRKLHQHVMNRGWPIGGVKASQRYFRLREAANSHVDPVEACAGHDADVKIQLRSSDLGIERKIPYLLRNPAV